MDNIFLLIFIAFIIGVLMFDLLFVGRGHHVVSIKEASVWTVVWVTLALGFFLFLRFDGHLVHGIDTFDELLHVTQKYGLSFKYDGLPLEQAMTNGLTIESAISQYQHSMSIDFLSGYLIEETLSIDNLFVMLMLLTGFGVRKKIINQCFSGAFWAPSFCGSRSSSWARRSFRSSTGFCLFSALIWLIWA